MNSPSLVPACGVLFSRRWNGHVRREFDLTGVEPEVIHLLSEFSYTGVLPVTGNNVEEVLVAADYYSMHDALRLCCRFLKDRMCSDNCIGIYKLADTFGCEDLKMAASRFVLRHFVHVARVSDEFVQLPLDDLLQFMERDDLNVKNERVVFEAVVRWIGHSVHTRTPCVEKLLSKVRLSLLDCGYLMNTVKCHEYVKYSLECQKLIISAFMSILHLDPRSTNEVARPRLPSSVLFAFGGWSGESPINAMECYDSRAGAWVNVPVTGEIPRGYHGTAFYRGYVFIVGGFDGLEFFKSVRRFDPVGVIWQEVAPMHSHRCYVSVVVLDNYLYALGGYDGFTCLNTAERYDHRTNQWTAIPCMQDRRSDAGATVLDGKIFICGGFNGSECLSTAECFTPQTNQWSPIASMNYCRSGVGVIACGGLVYVVGGFDGVNRQGTVEVYLEDVNSWSLVPSMLNPRSNFGLEVVDDVIVVAGGFNGYGTIRNVEGYDYKSRRWHHLMEMAVNRSGLSCCVADDLPNVDVYAAPRGFR